VFSYMPPSEIKSTGIPDFNFVLRKALRGRMERALCLAKILAGFETNNIAAAPPPAFCYNFDHVHSAFALVRSALPPLP